MDIQHEQQKFILAHLDHMSEELRAMYLSQKWVQAALHNRKEEMDTLPITTEQFDNLCEWLSSEEACNFQYRIPGDVSSITWNCTGNSFTRQWLISQSLDAETIITFLRTKLGMECDCEVVLNQELLEEYVQGNLNS